STGLMNRPLKTMCLILLAAGMAFAQKPIMKVQPAYMGNGSSVLDVTAYGAKGDGSTDSTEAIQAAIGVAMAVGGKVVFPPGNFLVSGSGLSIVYTTGSALRIAFDGAGKNSTTLT